MEEQMSIIELWIMSSKSIQEIDLKCSLIRGRINQIEQDSKRNLGVRKNVWQKNKEQIQTQN